MRAKEFIPEATKYRKNATDAIPGAQIHDHGINDSYSLYRFGIALAGSPDAPGDTSGPTNGQASITLAYSDADQEIINKTAKATGAVSRQLTTKGSKESSSVNTKSIVGTRKPLPRRS
jgi:hypothetical protein